MRAFSYACLLPVTWQRWRTHHSIRHIGKSHAACKLRGFMTVLEIRSYCRSKFYIAGFTKFYISTFLLQWPWPWPDDLHIRTWPYFLKIYRMCKYKLRTSMPSQVIVRQTDRHDRNYIPRRFAGGQKWRKTAIGLLLNEGRGANIVWVEQSYRLQRLKCVPGHSTSLRVRR